MASSRISSSKPDAVDVRYVLQAFEHINRVRIVISMGILEVEGEPLMGMEITAHDRAQEIGARPSLASVKLRLGYRESQQMEAAILQALYKLDADLARDEFAGVDNKRA